MQFLEGEFTIKKAGNRMSEPAILLGYMWLPLLQPLSQELVPHRISRGTHLANVQEASRQCFSHTLLCWVLL